MTMNPAPELSIILIARNESAHIAATIASVLAAAEKWQPLEIILVDSASSDDTVQIASQFPITVLRIPPGAFLSAGAGRYIGTLNSRGELLMFMDGDMEMDPAWLDHALPYMADHPEAAAITGYRHDIFFENGTVTGEQDVIFGPGGVTVEVKHFGGAALYRRAALEAVGGFNPYLISEEEPELCMRLRFAGYRLFCIPVRVCSNYTLPIRSWKYFSSRILSRLWLGHGQTPRYHLRTGMLGMVVRERATFVYTLGLILLALLSLGLVVWVNHWALTAAWFIFGFGALVGYGVYKGSPQEVIKSFVHQICVLYGGIRGFLIKPVRASQYPTGIEVIRTGFRRTDPVLAKQSEDRS